MYFSCYFFRNVLLPEENCLEATERLKNLSLIAHLQTTHTWPFVFWGGWDGGCPSNSPA